MSNIRTRIREPDTIIVLAFLAFTMLDNHYHFRFGTPMTIILAVVAILLLLRPATGLGR
jgi:hypothetical protein